MKFSISRNQEPNACLNEYEEKIGSVKRGATTGVLFGTGPSLVFSKLRRVCIHWMCWYCNCRE